MLEDYTIEVDSAALIPNLKKEEVTMSDNKKQAWKDCEKAKAKAWKVYWEAKCQAWKNLVETIAEVKKVYEEATKDK